MSYRFGKIFWCLLILFLVMLVASESSIMSAEKEPINYKLVPNLQQMSDQSAAPQFTLPTLEGGKVSLKDFRGKLLMLNFWASWCIPLSRRDASHGASLPEAQRPGFRDFGCEC